MFVGAPSPSCLELRHSLLPNRPEIGRVFSTRHERALALELLNKFTSQTSGYTVNKKFISWFPCRVLSLRILTGHIGMHSKIGE